MFRSGRLVFRTLVMTVVTFATLAACRQTKPVGRDAGANARMSHVAMGPRDASLLTGDGGAGSEQPQVLPGPLRACIARVQAATPPELAAALEAVEYTSAAEDGCRADMAARLREPGLCDGVVISAVRHACRERVAIARARPDDCPPAVGDRGLDPVCLALASHDVPLCAAAQVGERTRCLAVARDDGAQCASLDPLLAPRCRRDVSALHGLVPRMNGAPARAGTLHLRITPGPDPDAGGAHEWDLETASRGAYVDAEGTLYVVDPMRGWPSPFTPTSENPTVALAVPQPARPGRANLSDARIVMPDGRLLERSPLSVAPPGGEATFTHVAHGRSERVTAHLRAVLFGTGQPYVVEITLDTFVRDVVSRETLE